VIYAEMILTSRCSWQRGSMALWPFLSKLLLGN
jgi:hypothetical protein